MKKILFPLLAACALAACNNDDEPVGPPAPEFPQTIATYTCAMSVTSDSTALIGITQDKAVCDILLQEDSTYMLRMNDVQFDPAMPMPMTIDAPRLAQNIVGSLTTYTSAENPIIPEIGGTPYPQFPITNFSCSATGDIFTAQFDCMGSTAVLTNAKVEPADAVGSYSCALTVTDATGALIYSGENLLCDLAQADDDTFTLTMHDIKFAEAMPMTLTFDVAGLSGSTQGTSAIFTTTEDPIMLMGVMPATDFACSVSGERLYVTLNANNATAVLIGNLAE